MILRTSFPAREAETCARTDTLKDFRFKLFYRHTFWRPVGTHGSSVKDGHLWILLDSTLQTMYVVGNAPAAVVLVIDSLLSYISSLF